MQIVYTHIFVIALVRVEQYRGDAVAPVFWFYILCIVFRSCDFFVLSC